MHSCRRVGLKVGELYLRYFLVQHNLTAKGGNIWASHRAQNGRLRYASVLTVAQRVGSLRCHRDLVSDARRHNRLFRLALRVYGRRTHETHGPLALDEKARWFGPRAP